MTGGANVGLVAFNNAFRYKRHALITEHVRLCLNTIILLIKNEQEVQWRKGGVHPRGLHDH